MQTSEPRALSDPDHDVAHRLAGLDRFMRRHDVAEIEALRQVVGELAAFEHARDLGGRAGALLRKSRALAARSTSITASTPRFPVTAITRSPTSSRL